MWSLRCSFLIGDVVISTRSLDARETELTEMHPGYQKPFRTDNIQQPRSRRRGEMRILIERDRHVRPWDLDLWEMDYVAPDQQVLATGLKTVAGMSCRMTRERTCHHAGKHVAGLEHAQPATISGKRLTGEDEVAMGTLRRAAQITVILPERDFLPMGDELGIWECGFACGVEQSTDMVWMGVRQQDGLDSSRLDARPGEVVLQPAAPLFETARAGIDQDRATTSAHQIAVDVNSGVIRDARILLHLRSIVSNDIREQVEIGVEIAVTDGGDSKVANGLAGKSGHRHGSSLA